jgi:mitochondrial fission protein ELM1
LNLPHLYIITEEHTNTGRNNTMAGLATAIRRYFYTSEVVTVPRVFGTGPVTKNPHPLVAAFRDTVGETLRPGKFQNILQDAAAMLKPHLPPMRKGGIPVFFTYYGHPDSVLTGLTLKTLFPDMILASLGHPYRGLNMFDLIAAPPFVEDFPEGLTNVCRLDATPTHVTNEMLMQAYMEWNKVFAAPGHDYPTGNDCFITLIVGGPYAIFTADPREARVIGTAEFTPQHAREFCAQAMDLRKQVIRQEGKDKRVDFLITTSRRTPPEVMDIIFRKLGPHARWMYDPCRHDGPNPFLGMLMMASYLVVTVDSLSMVADVITANMVSDAPILVFAPPGLLEPPLDTQRAYKRSCDFMHRRGMITYLGEPIRRIIFPFDYPAEVIARRIREAARARHNKVAPHIYSGLRAACG